MQTTQIWYSVQNGGDGSAYPRFMESKALAEWDQDHMNEGWGEPCTGYIEIEHEGEIKYQVQTSIEYFFENGYWDLDKTEEDIVLDFVNNVFPEGLPQMDIKVKAPHYFTISLEDGSQYDVWCYNADKAKIISNINKIRDKV